MTMSVLTIEEQRNQWSEQQRRYREKGASKQQPDVGNKEGEPC